MAISIIQPALTNAAIIAALGYTPASAGAVVMADGSAASPGMFFGSDVDTGFYQEVPGDGSLSVSLAGVAAATFNSVGLNLVGYLSQGGNAMVADVPSFTSQFFGVYPVPALSTSTVGAISEVVSIGNMGTGHVAIGRGALANMTNGAVNVAVGYQALGTAQHEAFSVAVGWGALALSEAYENTAIGYRVLKSNTSGIQNTGIGAVALYDNISGNYNTALGSHALTYGTTGSSNTAAGYEAAFNTNADGNSAFGAYSLLTNISGVANSAFGVAALYYNTANGNSAFGYEALKNNASGTSNVAMGRAALLHSTGSNNVAIGHSAGDAAGLAGSNHVLVGYQAGTTLTGAAANNVMIGASSGASATTGSSNVLIGISSSGASTGQVTTGNRNVSIGYDVAVASPTADYQLNISNFIYGTGMSGTGATLSPGKIGFGVKAPATEVEVAGAITLSGATSYIAGTEITAPAAPAANGYRLFAQDNGAGKTQLMVLFATGAAQQLAIQP